MNKPVELNESINHLDNDDTLDITEQCYNSYLVFMEEDIKTSEQTKEEKK